MAASESFLQPNFFSYIYWICPGATLFGILPYAGFKFYIYETLKAHISIDGEPSVIGKLACGAVAGLIGQTFTYPLDVVRRQMQVGQATYPLASDDHNIWSRCFK
jgi:hypothetical protein